MEYAVQLPPLDCRQAPSVHVAVRRRYESSALPLPVDRICLSDLPDTILSLIGMQVHDAQDFGRDCIALANTCRRLRKLPQLRSFALIALARTIGSAVSPLNYLRSRQIEHGIDQLPKAEQTAPQIELLSVIRALPTGKRIALWDRYYTLVSATPGSKVPLLTALLRQIVHLPHGTRERAQRILGKISTLEPSEKSHGFCRVVESLNAYGFDEWPRVLKQVEEQSTDLPFDLARRPLQALLERTIFLKEHHAQALTTRLCEFAASLDEADKLAMQLLLFAAKQRPPGFDRQADSLLTEFFAQSPQWQDANLYGALRTFENVACNANLIDFTGLLHVAERAAPPSRQPAINSLIEHTQRFRTETEVKRLEAALTAIARLPDCERQIPLETFVGAVIDLALVSKFANRIREIIAATKHIARDRLFDQLSGQRRPTGPFWHDDELDLEFLSQA